jgi:hypothetical protein
VSFCGYRACHGNRNQGEGFGVIAFFGLPAYALFGIGLVSTWISGMMLAKFGAAAIATKRIRLTMKRVSSGWFAVAIGLLMLLAGLCVCAAAVHRLLAP